MKTTPTLIKSKRTYRDVETGERFTLYYEGKDEQTQIAYGFHLITEGSKNLAKGSEVNGFYLCPFDSCSIKINGEKIVKLSMGEFYNLKEDETITHKRWAGQKEWKEIEI